MVSGTISLPSRATFHHSLTVLSAIGHQGVFRLSKWSCQIHTRFLEPRATWEHFTQRPPCFSYGGLTLYAAVSHQLHLHNDFLTLQLAGRLETKGPTTPIRATPAGYHTRTV